METVHFWRGELAICGERLAEGVQHTQDQDKVTCSDCKAALAVTKLLPTPPQPVQAPRPRPQMPSTL